MKKILIAAGGTGGHLFPAQQLAEQLSDEDILFAGHLLEKSPFFEKGMFPFQEVLSHPFKKGFLSAIGRGIFQAIALVHRFHPDLVVGFGSYHTFPLLAASVLLRKKLVLFEANCHLGKVNRLFCPFADAVACQFPLQIKNRVLVEWLPWKIVAPMEKTVARAYFALDPNRKTLLVFGGSQGAAFFNEVIPKMVAALQKEIQVIHLTGAADADAVRMQYQQHKIFACVKPFEKEMALAYSAADVAICRSGASTIAELIRFAVPAILIPYPFASDDHQRKNGEWLAKVWRGARLLLQEQADISILCREFAFIDSKTEELKHQLRQVLQEEERWKMFDVIQRTITL